MEAYRAAGAGVAAASAILAAVTYVMLGVHPLLALWLGLSIAGLSMALTPSSQPAPRMYPYSEPLAALLESLGVEGPATYVRKGGMVIACIGGGGGCSGVGVRVEARGVSVAVPSPFSSVLGDLEAPCSVVDVYRELLRELGLARGCECSVSGGRIVCRVWGEAVRVPESLETRLGSPAGSLLASVAAVCLDARDEPLHGKRRHRIVEVEVVG